jgi:hypothetical protein
MQRKKDKVDVFLNVKVDQVGGDMAIMTITDKETIFIRRS